MAPEKLPPKTRRKVLAELARVEASVPITYVEAPIAKVLATANHIVATELAFIQRAQSTSEVAMSGPDSKRLLNLVSALEKSTAISGKLSDAELNSLSDAELEAELLAELERIRAKKKGKTL